ncbi:MAG TPA: DUF2207 domain-containing protein, partial [Armatimonadota bacterium]
TMRTFFRQLLLVAMLAVLPLAGHAQGVGERILDFSSVITVRADSSMLVRETIKVRAENGQIVHGIYREFPTQYTDSAGETYRVGFTVQSVTRDGQPEDYRIEHVNNGAKIYFGKSRVTLTPGIYTYTFTYLTDHQLGYFADHDELYWNVTGNGWVFPIDHASATVTLPHGINRKRIAVEGYTGAMGEKGHAYRATVDKNGIAHFSTTEWLEPYHGLTIVVSFPKGFVTKPTTSARGSYDPHSNNIPLLDPMAMRQYLAARSFYFPLVLLALALVLGYYLLIWFRYGRDPRPGTIIPRYFPPEGFSPADIRYLRQTSFDNRAFTAEIINLAVKGALTITETVSQVLWTSEKTYTLTKNTSEPQPPLSPVELRMLQELFRSGESLTLKATNYQPVQKASGVLQKEVEAHLAGRYFNANGKFQLVGVLASLLAVVVLGILIFRQTEENLFVAGIVGGLFFTIGLSMIWFSITSTLGKRLNSSAIGSGCLMLFFLPFAGMGLFGLLASGGSFALLMVGTVLINLIFSGLLKAYTPEGRRVLDEIEGFRMYLETAEKDRLNYENPPERTPQLFERFLPYALALDVEQAWSEQFAAVLAHAGEGGTAYQPSWYNGSLGALAATGLASSLGGAFDSAVSSSSTPPGSSSGSGGGGSSGGGGGGGGGGGW